MFFCKKKMEKNKNDQTKNNEGKANLKKDDEKNDNEISKIYTCNKCLIVPEITNMNYSENKISIKCPFHKTQELSLNDYLSNNNKPNEVCNKCNKNISNENFYCHECKIILCSDCKNTHTNEHNLIDVNEYNIKCQIHNDNKYLYYCYNCSSNLCEICHLNHDNEHNIIPLSNLSIKIDEIDYITNKNKEYEKIIQNYKNYISLNNILLDTYKIHGNNFYYMKNLRNIIRFMQNSDINKNIIEHMQNDLQKQNTILEKFNEEFETGLKLDTKVVYLNWKNIDGKALSTLCQIDFNKMIEFQSCGTLIEDISYFKNAKFPQLKELYLTDNNISDISILEDVDFENLTIIYLNKNKIKNINVFRKVKFYNLNKLFLDGNSIYDISVFKNIPLLNLENINLSRNIITDISPLKDINLKKLQILNIKKNGVDYSLKENSDIIHDLRDKSIRIVY